MGPLGLGLSIEPQMWALIFVMVRISAAFIAAPVFSAVSIPLVVRVSLSGAIGVLVLGSRTMRSSAASSLATLDAFLRRPSRGLIPARAYNRTSSSRVGGCSR